MSGKQDSGRIKKGEVAIPGLRWRTDPAFPTQCLCDNFPCNGCRRFYLQRYTTIRKHARPRAGNRGRHSLPHGQRAGRTEGHGAHRAESQKKLAEVDRKIEAAEVVLTDPKSVKRYKDLQAQAQQLRQTTDSYTAAMERLAQPQAPTGRPLTQEEAEALVEEMEAGAETAPEMELTPENWVSQFGEDGMVQTPLGAVKMGDNQYLKFAQKGRSGKLGMVKPTLENPDVIVEDKSFANEGQKTERASSYVFIKAFKKVDGSRYYLFTSVTVSKDGNEVVISNQEKSSNKISKLLQNGKITWIKESSLHPITQDGKPVSLNDSNKSTKSGSQPALLGINSPAIPDKDTQSSDNTEYFCNFVLGDHHSDCFCCFDVYCLIQIYENFRYFTNNQCINN